MNSHNFTSRPLPKLPVRLRINAFLSRNKYRHSMLIQSTLLLSLFAAFFIGYEWQNATRELSWVPAEVRAQEPEQVSIQDYAWNQAKKHNLDPVKFIVTIWSESGFNPEAINVNNNKTVDLGIAQINQIHKDISLKDRLDPYKAIDWAIQKRIKDGSYKAWYGARKNCINK